MNYWVAAVPSTTVLNKSCVWVPLNAEFWKHFWKIWKIPDKFHDQIICMRNSTFLCQSYPFLPLSSFKNRFLDHLLMLISNVFFLYQFYTKLTYMIIVGLMGVATMVVVMWEKFNQPEYRPFRAGVFVSLVFRSLKFYF